ncbi:UPF0481 protein At3g47200-like [Aristolochia californica]|uniref:UPF0481 protein At3g47200-like n=1 Tax=Aristolochia californica TaxID=171875 RepID=UPI0035E13E4D
MRAPKKDEKKNDVANAVTVEVQDGLLLLVDSPIDSWVLDLRASFHPTLHHEIMENYVAHGKVYFADGERLDIVGIVAGVNDWVIEITESLKTLPQPVVEAQIWAKQSIYQVPRHIKGDYPKQFEPQVVSIGPYHHGAEHLKPMEEHKQRALRRFLKFHRKPFDLYVNALNPLVSELKNAYGQLDVTWDDIKFLKLMIVDGCFMLEILRPPTGKYADNDPVFGISRRSTIMSDLKRDLMMIENQLPFLVLKKLLEVATSTLQKDEDIADLILTTILEPHLVNNLPHVSLGNALHVLDVVRKRMLGGAAPGLPTQQRPSRRLRLTKDLFPCFRGSNPTSHTKHVTLPALELKRAGINLQKGPNSCLKHLQLRNGVLHLPLLLIDRNSFSMFLNFMAFERHHDGAGDFVDSYLCFMTGLINSEDDGRFLLSIGAIEIAVGSERDVTGIFGDLSQYVTMNKSSWSYGVQQQLNEQYEINLRNRRTMLRKLLLHTKQKFFVSPWPAISVLVGTVLLAAQVIQTVMSILKK